MTLADRIKARMAHLNLSQAEVARRVGVAQPTIAKLVAGSSRSSSHLHRIARALETTPAYLAGETDDAAEGAQPLPTLESIVEVFGQVMVPLVDLSESPDDHDAAAAEPRFVSLSRAQLEPLIAGAFNDVFACEIGGDTMMPTLRDGDVCLIDRAQREIRRQDALWAVGFAGMTMVKRVRCKPGGTLELMSDNPVIPSMTVASEETTVLGRLVWRSGAI